MRKIRVSIGRLEQRLSQSPWLAGEDYMLADIVNQAATPHLVTWIDRINAHPAAQAMFAKSQSEMPPRAAATAA